MASKILSIDNLSAGYDGIAVQTGVTLSVDPHQFVALLGPNGAGKTTILRVIAGNADQLAGSITVCEKVLRKHRDAAVLAQHGVRFVWEQRNIFGSMSVDENLRVAGRAKSSRSLGEIYDLFPEVARRRSTLALKLSGGERSMLAIGSALIGRPRLLIADELSEGLQGKVIERIVKVLRDLRDRESLAMLVVEQNASVLRLLADQAAIVSGGRTSELLPIETALKQYADVEGDFSLAGASH